MQNHFVNQVYDTLHGHLTDDACVPGVENLFAEGPSVTECTKKFTLPIAVFYIDWAQITKIPIWKPS